MAVPRVEWQCPGCERRFAIRADMETPALCPECRAAEPPPSADPAAAPPSSGAAPVSGSSVDAASRAAMESAPVEIRSTVPAGGLSPQRRYPALAILSVVYRTLAVVLAVASLAMMIYGVAQSFTGDDAEVTTARILLQAAIFAGSLLFAATLYALGELLQLLVNIEANTRRSGERDLKSEI